jgi:hypothetical protein
MTGIRFIPEPVVLQLKSRAGNASLQALDDICENPGEPLFIVGNIAYVLILFSDRIDMDCRNAKRVTSCSNFSSYNYLS